MRRRLCAGLLGLGLLFGGALGAAAPIATAAPPEPSTTITLMCERGATSVTVVVTLFGVLGGSSGLTPLACGSETPEGKSSRTKVITGFFEAGSATWTIEGSAGGPSCVMGLDALPVRATCDTSTGTAKLTIR